MLARAPGDVARANLAQVQRSPPAAGFTPPGLGQRGQCARLRRERTGTACRAPRSHQPTARRHGPQAASSLAASICSRLAHLSPPGKGHVVRTGRPVRRGSARFPVTRPRCHRTTVPGVTSRCARSLPGRSLISAASTARWAQSHRASARCGAAPRPRAAARAVPHPRTPANDPAGQASQQAHEDQAAQTQRHGRSLCPAATPHLSRQVTAIGRLPAPPQAHRCSSQAGQASGNPTRVDIATGAPVLVDPGSTLCGCRTAYSPLRDPSCRRYS